MIRRVFAEQARGGTARRSVLNISLKRWELLQAKHKPTLQQQRYETLDSSSRKIILHLGCLSKGVVEHVDENHDVRKNRLTTSQRASQPSVQNDEAANGHTPRRDEEGKAYM